jgi:CheY-like chemotaxis protein
VVDDNSTAKKIMSRYLAIDKFQCFSVSSAKEALDFIEKNKVDILILDLMMPLEDGFSVAKKVRLSNPEIKLIASTADMSAQAISKIKEYEFDAYMFKPIRRRIVYNILKNLYTEQEALPLMSESQVEGTFKAQQLLVVDDNLMNLKLAEKIFSKMGHVVDTAQSGQLAIDRIEEKDFDIIFMDMQMPQLSGVETTQIIREKGTITPIIALTANAFESDRQECLKVGMNDFTTKPLRRNELSRLIQKYTTTQGKYVERRILIVEDDKTTSAIIKSILEKNFPGAIIKQAYNGLEAMSLVGSFMPSVLILDFMLPDMVGTKVMEFLKSHENYKDIKVLVNSSLESDDHRICEIRDMGAAGVLCKKDLNNQLIESIKYL